MDEDIIKIRPAEARDAEAIGRLTCEAYGKWVAVIGREPLPMAVDYHAALKTNIIELLFIGETLGALIETVSHDDHLLVENVAVSPVFQGRGLGRRLMAHVEQRAGSAGQVEIRLYTNRKFAGNIAFYEKQGYRVEREEDFRGGITVYMNKVL